MSEEEQRLALERLRGWAQWAQLEPMTSRVRFALVETDMAYHTFGLYDRLLEASRWYLRRQPTEAIEVVRLAIVVAERLDRKKLGLERVAGLRAAAWAALGNAKRVAEDFEGARRAFLEAWRIVEEEALDDPVDQAHITGLEASYLKDIGEFEMAEASLMEAAETYRRLGDVHQQGRALLQMGEIIGHVNPERGIAHLQKALALLELSRDPWLDLCAHHALAQFLSDAGQPAEALVVLERTRLLYQSFPEDMVQLRLHWLEGKIARALGEYGVAESIFQQLWQEFRVRKLNQEVVLVAIDLAQVLIEQRDTARAAELSAECFAVMKQWGLHKDALAAWLVFQNALAHGAVVGDLFARMESYFRRHWVRPGRFEAP